MKTFLKVWATPLTVGSFIVLSVTGILMFFHLDSGLNKVAHEWLGWALVLGGLAHVVLHFPSLLKHLRRPLGGGIIGAFALLLALSFIPFGGGEGGNGGGAGQVRQVVQQLKTVPLAALAPAAGVSVEDLLARLEQKGYADVTPQQTVLDISGENQHRQMALLGEIFR